MKLSPDAVRILLTLVLPSGFIGDHARATVALGGVDVSITASVLSVAVDDEFPRELL